LGDFLAASCSAQWITHIYTLFPDIIVVVLVKQVLGKITADGIYLEQLETNPQKYMPDVTDKSLGGDVVKVGAS